MAQRETDRALVRFDGVTKRFGGVSAVEALSLDIRQGEFFALLGPSGCGKTTLLRLLAGFETPDQGRILLDGEDIAAVPPHRRPVNMMFQNYALFPHLTVAANVAFGLKQEALPKREIAVRTADMLALVRLDGLGDRRPHQLSGGQRQRVALARALVKRPRVFLLDEPLAALDRKLREDTRFELTALQKKLGLTFVIVTHDQEEAMSLAGRIGVMNEGALAQVGPPAEIYERPNSRWVAGFIGDVNLLDAVIASADAEGLVLEQGGLPLRAAATTGVSAGDKVCLALRPEKIRLSQHKPDSANVLAGTIEDVGYLGGLSIYKVKTESGMTIKVSAANIANAANLGMKADAPPARGDRVWLSWRPDAGVVLTS